MAPVRWRRQQSVPSRALHYPDLGSAMPSAHMHSTMAESLAMNRRCCLTYRGEECKGPYDGMDDRLRRQRSNGARLSDHAGGPRWRGHQGSSCCMRGRGLTEPFRQACDRLAAAGFVALAPDLDRGQTAASVEEAETLGAALDQQVEQWRGDITSTPHAPPRNASPEWPARPLPLPWPPCRVEPDASLWTVFGSIPPYCSMLRLHG
jgi:hypothetical protein